MKLNILMTTLICSIASLGSITLAADDLDERAALSRAMVKTFGGDLQRELKAALSAEGPEYAVEVCQAVAPGIAYQQSENSGWEVGRTALKLRNPSNVPDAWERSTLDTFEQRKAAGEDVKALEYFEVVQEDGEEFFRYMKAIPTGDVCLTCHGTSISAPVQKRLADLYPDDQAKGFSAGDIRGAFTIKQPVN